MKRPCCQKQSHPFCNYFTWTLSGENPTRLDATQISRDKMGMSDRLTTPQDPYERAPAPLSGHFRVPGDKSISHRALILAAMATGTSHITGLLEGDDVVATAEAMRQLGAEVSNLGDGLWEVKGCGPAGFKSPTDALNFGNSGTGARLVMGVVAGAGISAEFTGDASLSRRPMARVTKLLAQTGAQIVDKGTGRLPLTITGAAQPLPLDVTPEFASAQVKSAILLAGLGAPGKTIVREKHITRDHTENMLALFGAKISSQRSGAENIVTLDGHARLRAHDIVVPGDPSSAAFPLVAALIVPGSKLRLENVLLNPQRDGLIRVLTRMGADIKRCNERTEAGEPIADLDVSYGPLKGIEVDAEMAPSMIDEYPALAVAAAFAEGTTHMAGIGELRVKESDRLAAVEVGLRENGVRVEAGTDSLSVSGGSPMGGACVTTHDDHRIAMAFLVMGLATQKSVRVDDTTMIATSFPNFFEAMAGIGARFGI